MTEVYNARKQVGPRSRTKAERVSGSLLEHHMLPLLGSRRMDTFDHEVVEGFVRAMERGGVGLATQANAFDKLKATLLDAHRLGLCEEHPPDGGETAPVRPEACGHPLT
ncbi:hypothetical protein ACFUCQ_23600 [Streptomyces sp. NPDC057197]|uniref:hypothetical protein n=1 Tax=unclassified Streptomyces TaxID=2593676 RepID=UPI001F1794FD|nr:hypothetical protein [Streptomyces sp. SAT1]